VVCVCLTRGWWLVVIPCRVALFGGAVARPTGFLSAHKARTVGPLSTFLLFTCTTRTQRRHQPHTGNSVTLPVHRLQHILHPGLHTINKRGQRRLQHRKETHFISGVQLPHGSIYLPFIYVVTTHTHTREVKKHRVALYIPCLHSSFVARQSPRDFSHTFAPSEN